MRYVFWHRHKLLIRNFIFFFMGIYVGFFIILYFHGAQIDDLTNKNNQLISSNDSLIKENEVLKSEKEKRLQNQLIRSVKFNFVEKVDPFIEAELLKALVEDSRFLVGKRTEEIGKSPEFIKQLFNNKTYKAKDETYVINVEIIYINTNIELWIRAKEQK